MRIEFLFERNTAYLSGFSNVRNISLCGKQLHSSEGKKHCLSPTKTIKVKVGVSCPLFPYEN
jgi:hypothetical protein